MSKSSVGIFALIVLALAAWSCKSTPDGIISHHKMAQLLADIHEGEGVIDSERRYYSSDSARLILRESIFRKNGVTKAMVDSSMVWYGSHIEDYMEIYDEAISILEKRLAKANAISTKSDDLRPTTVALEGDSVDLWTAARHRRFYDLGANNYVTYRVNRDANWESDDNYTFNFKLIEPRTRAAAMIIADYTDGTYKIASMETSTPGWNKVRLSLDADKTASSVAVVLNYNAKEGESAYVDSMSLVRVRKDYKPVREMPVTKENITK